jgi:Holliday junction DNA helicase RuvB
MLTSEDHALSQQWAVEWLAVMPKEKYCCICCHVAIDLSSLPKPTMQCPFCAVVPSPEACQNGLNYLAKQRKVQDERAAMEALNTVEDAPRCDPPGLDDVIGNGNAVAQIRIFIAAHKEWLKDFPKQPFPHMLLSGSGGLGKTMLAEIVAREVKRPIHLEMGQSLTTPSRIGDVLMSLKAGDILFVDECHGLKKQCQEALYRAMEDGVYVPIQKAGAPVVNPIHLPPFTLIGSTTDIWGLLPSFGQRFKYHVKLKRLSASELATAMLQRAKRKNWELDTEAATIIGARSHGTPRLAIKLFDGCMAVAKAGGESKVDAFIVRQTCEILEIDELGLDDEARRYLGYLSESNEPVRVNVLASKLDGLSRLTVERRIEPDLIWLGLIEKKENGRILTDAGRKHLYNKA